MQLQRVQTVWLILALGCLVAFLVLPFGWLDHVYDQGKYIEGSLKSYDFLGVIVPLGIAIILGAVAICSFRNPAYQTSVVLLELMMTLVTVGVVVYVLCDYTNNGIIRWNWCDAFLCGALLFEILAIMGIRHDRKLLRDSNRLR